jgi:hypothetical protein
MMLNGSAGCLLLFLVGCGGNAHVSGVVLEDGQPYKETAEMVALTFTRIDGAMSISASIQKDGRFVVCGPNNDGLPPGKYKVGFYSDIEGGRGKKRIKDLKPDASSLEIDLPPGKRQSIVLDLSKASMSIQ